MFIFTCQLWPKILLFFGPTSNKLDNQTDTTEQIDQDPRTTLTRLIWSSLNSYLATPPIARIVSVKNLRATPKWLPRFFFMFSAYVFLFLNCLGMEPHTVWSGSIWIKVKKHGLLLPLHQRTYSRGPESALIIPPFRPKFTYL